MEPFIKPKLNNILTQLEPLKSLKRKMSKINKPLLIKLLSSDNVIIHPLLKCIKLIKTINIYAWSLSNPFNLSNFSYCEGGELFERL